MVPVRARKNIAFLAPLVPYIPYLIGGGAALWGVSKVTSTVAQTTENIQKTSAAVLPAGIGAAIGYFGGSAMKLKGPQLVAATLLGAGIGFYLPPMLEKQKAEKAAQEAADAEAKAQAEYEANWHWYNPFSWF
jgi:hypothetical protein